MIQNKVASFFKTIAIASAVLALAACQHPITKDLFLHATDSVGPTIARSSPAEGS